MPAWRRDPAPEIESRIRVVLTGMLPLLRIEAPGISLVSFDVASGVVLLRVDGDCPDCTMSAATFREGIAAHLRLRVPEIREVRIADPSSISHE